ncbi:MAG TPA: YciI family protein [Candidatus Binatus sp.]|uniref:YciI family protein n=1 Tax=Candidatus Binatus sp. TaxID=2811406 RepID=UPI002F42F921
MKYMITGGELRGESESIDAEEINRRVRFHQQKLDELLRARLRSGRAGLINVSVGLGPSRETVTVKNRGGSHLRVDGPFPETKELVGGFDIIDFDSLEEAIEYAKYPGAHESLVMEVRPIREFWWISQTSGQAASKVFMLTSVEDERAALSLPEIERTKLIRQHQGVGAEYVASRAMLDQEPGLWVGARLEVSKQAKTIRWKNGGRQVTDGPFAETKEVAGGFNLVACASIDEAITWANKLALRDGDAIEVRPVEGCWWVYHE